MKFIRFDFLTKEECLSIKDAFTEILSVILKIDDAIVYDNYDINDNTYSLLIPYDKNEDILLSCYYEILDKIFVSINPTIRVQNTSPIRIN